MPAYLETMEETLGADAEIGLAHARAWVLDEAVGGGGSGARSGRRPDT